jgi:diguanylate cyclase (GGDEF)-like protein/PAS domain S-box-containing protein
VVNKLIISTKPIVYSLLLIVIYVVAGKLGLMLALPPGYASPIFPPAGIAIAAVFIAGKKILPAVFIGSMLLNIWVGYSSNHQINLVGLEVATLIALASTVQAMAGGWWLRHALGYPTTLDSPTDVVKFFLYSSLVCMISASISVSGLFALGLVEKSSFFTSWASWWVGDYLGLIIMLPLTMVAIGQPRAIWRKRFGNVALPMLITFALLILIFVVASRWERKESLIEFDGLSNQLTEKLSVQFKSQEDVLAQTSALFTYREFGQVTRLDFHNFVQLTIKEFPMIYAIEWVPRISHSSRNTFVANQWRDFPDFDIKEVGKDKALVSAAVRDYYYPLTYIEPMDAEKRSILGFDIASVNDRKTTVLNALRENTAVATPPIKLILEQGTVPGMLLLYPVKGNAVDGVVQTVLKMNDFLGDLFQPVKSSLKIRLIDVESGQSLYDSFADNQTEVLFTRVVEFGTRNYRLELSPTALYSERHRGWQSWSMLSIGVFGTGLMGALLLLGTGYTARVLTLVDEKTLALQESSSRFKEITSNLGEGVYVLDKNGLITFTNPEAQRLLGWTEAELEGQNAHLLFHYKHLDQSPYLEDECEMRNVMKSGLSFKSSDEVFWKKDGTPIHIDVTSVAMYRNEQIVGAVVVFDDITERKKSESELAWLNRALLMLSECNETVIHMTDETKLIVEICRIIVEVGGYRMAWVGYAENDDYKSIKPQAYYGYNKGFLENIKLSWSIDNINGLGPGGRTIRDGKAIIVESMMTDPSYPLKSEALQQGFLALVSLPLKDKDRTFGLLAMYSNHVRKFAKEEVGLLQDLADNLAVGINNIRTEKERQHLNSAMLKLAKAVSATRGEAFFEQLIRNMVDTVKADTGYMAKLLPKKLLKGRTVAALVDGAMIDNFEYLIPDSTFERLFGSSDLIIVPNHAEMDFSGISMMRFYPYKAFAGLCLHDSDGIDIGLLFVFFKNPIDFNAYDLIKSTLKIFAARAASELQRLADDERIHEQAALLDITNDPIIVRDIDQNVTYWNKAAEALYGWTEAEVLHQPIYLFLKQDASQLEAIKEQLLLKSEWVGEITEYHKNGNPLVIEAHLTLVRDAQGNPKSIFAIKTDISKRKLAEEEIRLLAFYDPLTKLSNRRLLMDRLEKALTTTARSKQFGALVFIDLDNFKILNDTLGHDKGDQLLKEIAERLKSCVRDSDTVSRLGGDEFVILLEDLHQLPIEAKKSARIVGKKILDALNHTFDFDGYQHLSTASIGIALFNHETVGLDELLKQADAAMYKSKVAGRNRMTFYEG